MHPLSFASKAFLPIILNIVEKCDAQAWSLLGPYESQTICFNIQNCDPVYLVINNQKLTISTVVESPDVSIHGTLANFFEILLHKNFTANKIRIHGNIELARALFETLEHIDLNLEAQLAKVCGQAAASTIMHGLRVKSAWKKDFVKRQAQNLNEYLQQESGLAPSGAEVEHFNQAVDTLRHDVERLEARINLLGDQ